MRVLLAQLEPEPAAPAANAGAVAAALAEHPAAELAVFPEMFLTGYDPDAAAGAALTPEGAPLASVRDAAAEHATAVVVGFAERVEAGIANSLACIDADGTLAATYRKTHLFGADERAAFVAGDELVAVELAGRCLGVLICFDSEFPELPRRLARAGCELFVTAAANMDPYGDDHELAMRSRALENRRPHIYVNRTGAEAGLSFTGRSAAIGANGALLATAGAEPELLLAELELDPGEGAGSPDVDYLEQLRDDIVVGRTISTQGGNG